MKKLIFAFLLYCPFHVFAQGWSFDYSIGYGSYQLDDIKTIQSSMQGKFGLEITDRFPSHITHSAALGYNIGRHSFGSNFSYLTTGGRLHRADYSGSYTVDMIMNGYRVGAFYRHSIKTGFSPVSIYLQISPGVLFSSLEINEQVTVYTESDQENTKLKGHGFYTEPTIGVNYNLSNYLQFSLGGGYEIDFLSKMKYSGQETNVEALWTGFRFYGGLIFVLPTTKKITQ